MLDDSKNNNNTVKDYIIKSKLGIGSYGTVFKVIKKSISKN